MKLFNNIEKNEKMINKLFILIAVLGCIMAYIGISQSQKANRLSLQLERLQEVAIYTNSDILIVDFLNETIKSKGDVKYTKRDGERFDQYLENVSLQALRFDSIDIVRLLTNYTTVDVDYRDLDEDQEPWITLNFTDPYSPENKEYNIEYNVSEVYHDEIDTYYIED